MTGGLLPAGLQATDFPQNLYDIELCVSNLRELPDNLDTKWLPNSVILLEYGLLTTIPAALIRLEPNYLFVTGNPIEELPPEIFSTPEMYALSISNTKIRELPRNVTLWSPMLHRVFILDTDISSFWFWVDEVIEQNNEVPTWVAGRSIYCNDLEKILNGTANAFQVPLSPEYSAILMDPSEANWPRIFRAVDCDIAVDPLFYPLSFEDSINAISTPPEFVKIVPRTRLVTDVMYPTSN
ncbi:Centrosomal protein of 41 kDa [Phytophthora boehmeriae]|uniref:Centrosomal protein of 41 kDa n=1 Tax=Phytophthora boehmeriae TaxID=109152 RepID=A0A8T1WRI8_9STRA|nr:Centrosomal protein of 41 kDa [Phytophthora boehmeriae]